MIGFDSLSAKFGWRSERYQCVFPSDCGKPAVLLFLLEDHRRVVLRWSLTCQRPQAAFARLLGVSSALQGPLRVLAHAEAARAIDYSGM